ncbi:MAG: hypothetical protein IJ618_00660 [Prevotella sp.]|nr:hypothetical protein [Prevotella sp.]
MNKQVKIKVDAAAFEYSSKKWTAISGVDPSKVTIRLSKGEGLPSKEDAAIVAQLDQLLIAIEDFKPMTLMGGEDGAIYHTQIAMWHKHLLSIKKRLKRQCKPQYLVDVVNDILKESKSKLRCSLLVLTKCLHILGEQNLSPEAIVSTIIGNESTDWEKLPVPLNIVKKTLLIFISKTSAQQASEDDNKKSSVRNHPTLTEQVQLMYMFPYSCKTKEDNTELGNKIENDLRVIEEYVKWARECGIFQLDDAYKAKFNSFRSRLQTLPQKKVDMNTEETDDAANEEQQYDTSLEVALEKQKRMEILNESDQLAMLQEYQCPRCGSPIKRATNSRGIAYLRCNTCNYFAGIENGQPYVNQQYREGVMPARHDS